MTTLRTPSDFDTGVLVLECRSYKAAPGRRHALLERFHETTFPLFRKHEMNMLFFGQDPGNEDLFHYFLSWPDQTIMQQTWQSFAADEHWLRARALTESDGPLIASIQRKVLLSLT
jgi:hypothetical protein